MDGWRLALDPAARRTDGGATIVGGAPLRIIRLSPAGRRWLDAVAAGEPVPEGAASVALARRLVDAGIANPLPPPDAGPDPADVVVVVPVRDDAPGLAATLARLGPVGRVVVVDDGSRAPVAVEAGTAGPAPVEVRRREVSGGPGAAREDGWRATQAPVVAFVDANVEPEPGWLDALLPHFADPSVGAVAPRVRARAGAAPRWLARYEAERSSLDMGPVAAAVRPGSRVPYVPTAAVVVRRAALEAVGGFDPALRIGEDVDLIWRLHRAGWRVRYEPAAAVTHPCRPTLGAWLRQRYTYGTSAAVLHARHGAAVAALSGVSGWSALAWGAVAAGHPLAGVAVGAGTTAALVPKLRALDHPVREAVRLAGAGHLWSGRRVADAARRSWWPLAAALAVARRRSRLPVAAAALTVRPLHLLDDLAYGTGVWAGCLRARDLGALRPSFTGPLPRPSPPGETADH